MENPNCNENTKTQISHQIPPQALSSINPYTYFPTNYPQIPDYHILNTLQNIKTYPPPIENYTDPHLNNQTILSQNQNLHNSPKSNTPQKNKPYVFLLINTIENLMKEGKISKKYLDEKTENINSNSESSFLSSAKATTNSNERNSKNKSLLNNKNNSDFNNKNEKDDECENPHCHHVFNSNKEKIKIKIKGMKTQEKKLCEKCCEAVEKGDFCYYCNGIYRDGVIDTAVWVQCEFCRKWVHFDCELSKGKRYSNKQELNEEQKYMCPICTNEKAEQKISESKLKKKLINKKRKNDAFENQKIKNKRKEIKSEKCSELLKDVQMIESIKDNSQ